LNVSEECFIVENAADCSVEPVNSWIVYAHFLASQTFPENNFWFLFCTIDCW
jgi:hypothetical protein